MKKLLLALLGVFAVLGSIAAAQGSTTVYVNPQQKTADINETFSVSVDITTNESVYAFDVVATFNPAIVNALGISEGNFLKKDGASMYVAVNKADNGAGKLEFAATRFSTNAGVSGSGTLFSVNFLAKSAGTSHLDLKLVEVADNHSNPIISIQENGTINVKTLLPACDIADIDSDGDVDSADLAIWQRQYRPLGGCTAPDWCSGADIDQDGDVDSADLAIWQQRYNPLGIGIKPCQKMEVFYFIAQEKARCEFNIFDLVEVVYAFGSQPGSGNWNQDADLTGDGRVDVFDMAKVGINYGKTC